ncbi:MAG: hypothetical protein PHZ02_07115 [Desulfocapsaceae bacterium]|nr:hypothetical protein [Desulfocapsaceae bacterium]
MRAAKITQVEIANMLKVTPVAVHNVVSGKRKTPRIRKAIAMAIGKKVSEIWTDTPKKQNTSGPVVG